jgi:hypothetical protein
LSLRLIVQNRNFQRKEEVRINPIPSIKDASFTGLRSIRIPTSGVKTDILGVKGLDNSTADAELLNGSITSYKCKYG